MRLLLLNPAGLATLAGLVVPIAVHLLVRRRARVATFPSLRFVPASHAAAVRVRAVSDWWLLAVRCALVAVAAGALAQPLLVTPARLTAWNARVARAIVVDTSPSTSVRSAAAYEVADRSIEERPAAFRSHVIPGRDLRAAIREAVDWLEAVPPSRRELVVVSDFQPGALDGVALDRVPRAIGIHLRQLPPTGSRIESGIPTVVVEIRTPQSGERHARAALEAAGQTAETAARPDSSTQARTVVVFTRGAEPDAVPGPLRAAWMAAVAGGLAEDPELTGELRRTGIAPIASGALDDRTMTATLNAPASAFVLPLTIRAIRRAALAPAAWREHEQATLTSEALAAWSRPPLSVGGETLRPNRTTGLAAVADEHDARWLWLGVLALIGLETILRRRLDRRRLAAPSEDGLRAA